MGIEGNQSPWPPSPRGNWVVLISKGELGLCFAMRELRLIEACRIVQTVVPAVYEKSVTLSSAAYRRAVGCAGSICIISSQSPFDTPAATQD